MLWEWSSNNVGSASQVMGATYMLTVQLIDSPNTAKPISLTVAAFHFAYWYTSTGDSGSISPILRLSYWRTSQLQSWCPGAVLSLSKCGDEWLGLHARAKCSAYQVRVSWHPPNHKCWGLLYLPPSSLPHSTLQKKDICTCSREIRT